MSIKKELSFIEETINKDKICIIYPRLKDFEDKKFQQLLNDTIRNKIYEILKVLGYNPESKLNFWGRYEVKKSKENQAIRITLEVWACEKKKKCLNGISKELEVDPLAKKIAIFKAKRIKNLEDKEWIKELECEKEDSQDKEEEQVLKSLKELDQSSTTVYHLYIDKLEVLEPYIDSIQFNLDKIDVKELSGILSIGNNMGLSLDKEKKKKQEEKEEKKKPKEIKIIVDKK